MNLDESQIDKIKIGAVKQECFDAAMRLITRRLHSRAELTRKLSRREYGQAVMEAVLSNLSRLGYLDDARFARTKALSAAQHRHHGRRRAYAELVKSGVEGETARRALEDVYNAHDSMATARMLAQKQAARLRKLDPVTARRRLAGMLQRRGFTYDEIRPVIDEVLGADARTDDEGEPGDEGAARAGEAP
jgi:regulatory protein